MERRGASNGAPMMVIGILLVVILLVTAWPIPLTASSGSKLYIGHHARLTAEIPRGWSVPSTVPFDYSGADGFVVSEPIADSSISDACHQVASSHRFTEGAETFSTTWKGTEACRIDGGSKETPVAGLVTPHPRPFNIGDEYYQYAAILTDPTHFASITGSMSFDPDLVTPEAYLDSVVDLIQNRSYWTDDVDWTRIRNTFREDALGLIRNAGSPEEIHFAISQVLDRLQQTGDNHSFFREKISSLAPGSAEGFGMAVDGAEVTLVYPNGPAEQAGLRVGDVIVSVDGHPFTGIVNPSYEWDRAATLTIDRHGSPDPVIVDLESGEFDIYLAPRALPITDDIGYVELFDNFLTVGRAKQYATEANAGIARTDVPAKCGWMVDLRRNGGGGFYPMVTGVGSILGEGPILTWKKQEGWQAPVVYRHGRIYEDGREVSGDLVQGPVHTLQTPDPPVAVLIGPQTASSGEATALSFASRPDTRFFGDTTGGLTTGNVTYPLFDGAVLVLATVSMADRTGTTHVNGIEPDVTVPIDWTVYGTAKDPVIQAALEWLNDQPACADRTLIAPDEE